MESSEKKHNDLESIFTTRIGWPQKQISKSPDDIRVPCK